MAEPTELEVRLGGTRAEVERIGALLDRAQQGDAAVVLELRKVLDEQPHLWRDVGDLARVTEAAWIQKTAGPNLFFRESLTRRVRELRRQLQGEAPTPLARLLVDRVVCTWIALAYAESVYARGIPEHSLEQGTYLQERISRYQRLHLASIRALATLRRLEQRGPLVAVGVGVAQLNVAAPCPEQPLPAPGVAAPAPSGAA